MYLLCEHACNSLISHICAIIVWIIVCDYLIFIISHFDGISMKICRVWASCILLALTHSDMLIKSIVFIQWIIQMEENKLTFDSDRNSKIICCGIIFLRVAVRLLRKPTRAFIPENWYFTHICLSTHVWQQLIYSKSINQIDIETRRPNRQNQTLHNNTEEVGSRNTKK
jgi:glucan phosphoethanolaminetransferase (alkaline phosphatase superfamily)